MLNILPGTPGPDTLDGDIDAPDSILGGDDADLLLGNGAGSSPGGASGTDYLEGGAGADTLITSGSGFGVLRGGEGDDSIVAFAPGVDTGEGGAGNDTLIGDAGQDFLVGDEINVPGSTVAGNDVIDGGGGDDALGGGLGDDTLSPGVVGTFVGRDLVSGGDGEDVLALPGGPQDYRIVNHGGTPFVNGFPAGSTIIESIPASGPGSGVRAFFNGIEAIALGVTAQQLAGGAAPLTTVEIGALFDNSANSGTGRAHYALSDTVQAARGTQQVAISIAGLLSNDFDPDGDTLTLLNLLPTVGPGITAFRIVAAADVGAEGYDPALFPEGILLVDLAAPLAAPLRFTYRTVVDAEDASGTLSIETGSTATVTLNPVGATDDVLRGTYGRETFIPYGVLLANDGPGAVFGGISNAFITDGSITDDPLRGGIVIDSTSIGSTNVFFDYTLAGFAGTASVTVNLDNGAPVAVPLARLVAPGTTFTITFDEIANHPGHLDPNLDFLAFGAITGSSGGGATFTVTATGIDVTFDAAYSGGFALGYTLVDQSLGAESAPSTISFLTTAPPAPVANADTLTWGIGDGLSLFQGSPPGYGVVWSRELLANDVVMPGTVRIWNVPFDTTPGDNSQLLRVLERGIPGVFGVTDPADNGFGLEFRGGFQGTDTFTYTIIDPLGRTAQGSITFDVSVPQPTLANNVITIPLGATSLTLTAAEILGNDSFTGAGAIAEVNGFGVGGILDSGIDIGGGRTAIEGFTVTFDPNQLLSSYDLRILTFDTAADGGSANGTQTVSFVRQAGPSVTTYSLASAGTTVTEGTGTETGFLLTISRTGPLGAAQVGISVAAGLTGDPVEANDFPVAGGFRSYIVNFAANDSEVQVLLRIAPDAVFEANETFRVTLDSVPAGAAINPAANRIDATILDDDAEEVFLSGIQLGVTEGGGNTFSVLFERLAVAGLDIGDATVTYVIEGGTAQSEDVVGGFRTGSVTFAAGELQKVVEFEVVDDTLAEGPETVQIRLTGATGAQLSTTLPLTGLTTIADDDTPPASTAPTQGADSLVGSAGADTVNGLAGNDTILGLADADWLLGGPGDDTLLGGNDDDTLFGWAGDDLLSGEQGDDVLRGNRGNDLLDGGEGNDTLVGGGDLDTLRGGTGNDRLTVAPNQQGEAGDDTMIGTAAADTLDGGADNDLAEGLAGDDSLAGGAGQDTLVGARGADTLDGGQDADLLRSGAGNDSLLGGTGNDTLRADDGEDHAAGGAGADSIDGGDGADTLLGGEDDDHIAGRPGNDSLEGNEGADTLRGGNGDDVARGGAGRDLVRGGAGADTLFGEAGDDRLVDGSGANLIEGGDDDGAFIFAPGPFGRAIGTTGGDVVDLRGPGGGGNGAADTIVYRVDRMDDGTLVTDGLDVVLGFETNLDRILLLDPDQLVGTGGAAINLIIRNDGGAGFVELDLGRSGGLYLAGAAVSGASNATPGEWIIV